jgi:acetolactate synthase-1/2/3 large subunit
MVTAGDAVAAVLHAAGVRRFYTVPGESFLPIIDAVDRHPSLRLVSTRHESGAAFMAEADAKLTGAPAVAAGTRGVGAANLAIGVHTAYQDSTPMVVLLGQVETGHLGREAFQEVDLPAFYAPITKWATTVPARERIPELVAQACRIATSGRPGPTMLAFPADVLDGSIEQSSVERAVRAASVVRHRPAPDVAAVRAVSERLAAARRPIAIVGSGARNARSEVVRLAERYGVGVYTAFRRQDCFPNDHPLYLGHLGLGVSGERLGALRSADLVLVLGSRLSEVTTSAYTLPGPETAVVQVDADPATVGSVVALELGVVSDVAAFAAALVSTGAPTDATHDWAAARAAYEQSVLIRGSRSAGGIDPAHVVRAMRAVFPTDAVIANDAGNFSAFLHQHWSYAALSSQLAPTNGAMGYGVPAAVAAKLAAPDRTVVGVCGDGGFTMTALEVETAVREGLDVTIVVLRNGLQGTIAMHQARETGRLAGVRIGAIDLAALARSLGADGITVTREEELEPALRQALATSGPVVVDVVTDPDVISPSTTLAALLERRDGSGSPP